MQSKQMPDFMLGNGTNKWSKVKADARCPSGKNSLSSKGNNAKGDID